MRMFSVLLLFSMFLFVLPITTASVSSVDALSVKTFSVNLHSGDVVQIEVVLPEDGIYFAFEDPSGELLAGNCYIKEGKNYTIVANRTGDHKVIFGNSFSLSKKSFYFEVLMYPKPISSNLIFWQMTMAEDQYFLFEDPNAWSGVFVVLLAIFVLVFAWRVHGKYQ